MMPPKKTLIPGRWQPLHAGHVALIRQVLDCDRDVVVGIFETPRSERNPYTVAERLAMFREALGPEMNSGRVELVTLPWVEDIAYGRDCGWGVTRVVLPAAIEDVSGTAIRAGGTH